MLPRRAEAEFFILDTYDQLETVYHGLLEPKPSETVRVNKQDIDLLIVPGLLFDKGGFGLALAVGTTTVS